MPWLVLLVGGGGIEVWLLLQEQTGWQWHLRVVLVVTPASTNWVGADLAGIHPSGRMNTNTLLVLDRNVVERTEIEFG